MTVNKVKGAALCKVDNISIEQSAIKGGKERWDWLGRLCGGWGGGRGGWVEVVVGGRAGRVGGATSSESNFFLEFFNFY